MRGSNHVIQLQKLYSVFGNHTIFKAGYQTTKSVDEFAGRCFISSLCY